jgi:hypothetical protein
MLRHCRSLEITERVLQLLLPGGLEFPQSPPCLCGSGRRMAERREGDGDGRCQIDQVEAREDAFLLGAA